MPKLTCSCGARLSAPDALLGKLVKCPKCASPVRVAVVEAEIDLLPEPAPTAAAAPVLPPRAPLPRRIVPPKPPTVPAWKLLGRWALALALLPLFFSLFTRNDAKERLERMLKSDPELQARIAQLENKQNAKEDDVFALLPEQRVAGALLSRFSKLHWFFALISASAFWGFLLLVYPMGNASPRALWAVGLFTGTVGILLLLGLQLAADHSQGVWIRGRGLLVILFYIIKFIGFSYQAALDPDNGFILSMIGFTFGVGFCEEVCKLLPLLWHYKRAAKLDLSGAVVWGLASGVGFGVSEGVMYSSDTYNGIHTGEAYIIRFVSCVALHAIWNGFSSVLLWKWQSDLDEIGAWYGWFLQLFKIAGVSMVLHGFYDTALKKDHDVIALLTALVSVAAFFWLYERVKKDEPALTRTVAV